ncbi:MAG: LD-carboxypeptidase [Halioglobus sp.]|nr:LD-carboxypeptidase [Halioglobus sp.]
MAIVSPSFTAPAYYPHVYQLGLQRLQENFGLVPVEYPSTSDANASAANKIRDLVAAFSDEENKAVIATIGGDIQVTYVKTMVSDVFVNSPKPFFGYSDNSHIANFLFLNGIPSFYGGSVFTQFAMQGSMDEYTVKYLRHALFDTGEIELVPSDYFNDVDLSWGNPDLLNRTRLHERSEGWSWEGNRPGHGKLWGGCLESVDEMLRHDTEIPTLESFENIVLMFETSEEIPHHDYVSRVVRAFGERGILDRVQGVLMGRAKAWEFSKQQGSQEKRKYRDQQQEVVLGMIRSYNESIPVVQNMDFGHTDPQIAMPYGNQVKIYPSEQRITAIF